MRAVERWWVGALCLAVSGSMSGCGGGGGGGGTPAAPPTPLGRFEASLSGAAESTVVDPTARGLVFLDLSSDGTLAFVAAVQPAWGAAVTGLHVHTGVAGTDGPILVDLLSGGATFDASTHVAQGTVSLSPADAAAIAADPAQFYVNVHTAAATAGLARGQLAPAAAREWHALCLGDQESPPTGSTARAGVALRAQVDGQLTWVIALRDLALAAVEGAHVHVGAPGLAGPIVLDLSPQTATPDGAAQTLTNTIALSDAALARVALDPEGFYVNLHTAAFPGGEIRGQLSTGVVEAWAHLRGDRETTVVDPAARGGVTLELHSFSTGRAILAVPVAQGIDALTGAHLHSGPAGFDGPVVVDLRAGSDYEASAATGSGEGSITLDQGIFARLLADPASFYVNFHTATAPAGLVRGQVKRSPETLVALLAAANEVPPVTGGGAGKLRVVLTGVHACQFDVDFSAPPATDVLGLHVHDGAAGVNGPILIDLLGGSFTVDGSRILGSTSFTGRTFARLLADASAFYGNAHTSALPTGAARGQLLLLTEDSPPAGLLYDSPVTYETGAPIPSNVPDSVGGAVTSYAVQPALPAGLLLDPVTGVLSGTPTTVTAAANYTVTASNAAGFSDAVVNIEVVEGPPLTLSYTSPVSYVTGTPIPANVPTATGGTITSFSVTPALPAGLSLHATTGVISGTPTATQAATDHTITGSNGAGSVQAVVNVKVDAALQAPSGLSYTTPVVYTTGTAITPNTPTVGGGAVATWSVSPALPAGLSLDPSTGVISGTPTTVTAGATYTVTASNAAGSTNAGVHITVNLGAPANLTYTNNPALGYVSGGTFPTMTPSSTGGAVATYSIAPALPPGITLNTTTGVISGAPTQQSGQTTYTVTATNAAGNTTANVTITVLP